MDFILLKKKGGMLFLEWLFFTSGPVELVPNEPSSGEFFFSAVSLAFHTKQVNYLFFFSFFIVASAVILRMKRDPVLIALFRSRPLTMRPFFFAIAFLLIICVNIQIAACDGGIPSPVPNLHPEVPPDTGVPQGAPVQIPVPPEIPQLEEPLMSVEDRWKELQLRLSLYFLGRNSWSDVGPFVRILERQVPIETKIEAALVDDGYNREDIHQKRFEIRGILFNRGVNALSERTLDEYLDQIERNGTRQSTPYRNVSRAIQNLDLIL